MAELNGIAQDCAGSYCVVFGLVVYIIPELKLL